MKNQICLLFLTAAIVAYSLAGWAHESVDHKSKTPSSLELFRLGREMNATAKKLLAALDSKQKDKSSFSFSEPTRTTWNFEVTYTAFGIIPLKLNRRGIALQDMTQAQQDLVWKLLDTGLSSMGLDTVKRIKLIEETKSKIRIFPVVYRKPKVWLSIFGDPDSDNWAWKIDAHHIVLNFTIHKGIPVSMTPAFFGSQPLRHASDAPEKKDILLDHRLLGQKLVKTLNENQKQKARLKVGPVPHAYFFLVPGTEPKPLTPHGLYLSEMNDEQRKIVIDLVVKYLEYFRPELARQEWKTIEGSGLEKLSFAYFDDATKPDRLYFRVEGDTFVMEFDRSRPKDPNHVHLVWRDVVNEFGRQGSALAEHYLRDHQADLKAEGQNSSH